MQDFLVGPVGFLEYLIDFRFYLGSGAGSLRDEFDQVTRILQVSLDPGNVGKIIQAEEGGYRQVTSFLDQSSRLLIRSAAGINRDMEAPFHMQTNH